MHYHRLIGKFVDKATSDCYRENDFFELNCCLFRTLDGTITDSITEFTLVEFLTGGFMLYKYRSSKALLFLLLSISLLTQNTHRNQLVY